MTVRRYAFPTPLRSGRLLSRYKRFFADIALDTGETITAHCPNTGPMSGVCDEGSPVQVSYHADPKRKLAYTWEMIWVDETWVGINTSLPNRLIGYGLEQGWFAELAGFAQMKREVAYGSQNSKIDFLLISHSADGDPRLQRQTYVEVKNTTWQQAGIALFPDTVTTRGQKHLQELMEVAEQGHRAVLLYVINRGDCAQFAPGDERDPQYGRLLRIAMQRGVEVLPYRFGVSPEGLEFLGLAEMSFVLAD